jgi:imidazolonepropionase-like amidohydrolase
MRLRTLLLATALAAAAAPALSQVRAADLMKPPADARHYVIQSTGGKHGDSWSWTGPDGTRLARETMNLRGQVWEVDYRGKPGADGTPATITVRGFTPQGDAAETFWIEGGSANWRSPIDGGSAQAAPGTFYVPLNAPIDAIAWLAERLLAAPDHSVALLPGGKAHAKKLTSFTVHGEEAGDTRAIDLWSVTGISNSPIPVWTNPDGTFFGLLEGIAYLPEAYAREQAALETAQAQAMAGESAELARELGKNPATTVAFTGVRLFDSEGQRFLENQTVLVEHGKIAAVGPTSMVKVPAHAFVIGGGGGTSTLLPGLWDCHMHVGDDYTGVQELSLGVTSVRDPGNDDRLTIDRRKRTAAGKLLFPHVYPSSLIDGKGPYTAQVANVATSEREAIELVDRAKANHFTGVKFYGTFNRLWLPAAIAEAHKLGLHVHGHIPVGMRPLEAIADGYDEVTHINWIIMQAMPDSVIAVSNGIARFEGPGRYGKDVDLNGPAITEIVSTMAGKHIYSDPTMVAFEGLYVPENGDLSPAYAAFQGTLPPVSERGFRQGGFAVPAGLTRADYRASWAKMVALLKKMHEAGIPIVAGTDGSGLEIVRELEIYQQAGFSPAEALASATIVPARLLNEDHHTGSITVGKTADLVLVEGDPSQSLGSLRQTRMVMLDGRLLDADALRRVAGFSGRPQ